LKVSSIDFSLEITLHLYIRKKGGKIFFYLKKIKDTDKESSFFQRYKRRNKRISFVVKTKKARKFLAFFVGKIRDRGSNFSHETRLCEAAGDLTT